MKISIITVCYNAVKEIEQTILSVLNQDYPDIEYILIDGKSTDGTLDIIERYKDRITKVISEPDKGIYDAMNKSIALATGDYINFMNAGDRFASPDVLSQIAASNPSADIIYGNTFNCNAAQTERVLDYPRRLSEMPRWGVFCHQSAFIRTDYHKTRLYDLRYRSMADYDFFRHAYLDDHCSFFYLDMAISEIDNETGMSKENIDRNYKELISILGAESKPLLRFRLNSRRIAGKIIRRLKK